MFALSVACAIIPVVYVLCLVTLITESPIFYLMKGNAEKARLSLQFLRGPFSNIDRELDEMKNFLMKVYLPNHFLVSRRKNDFKIVFSFRLNEIESQS